jgi:uncharacterized protein (UPF0333 family)
MIYIFKKKDFSFSFFLLILLILLIFIIFYLLYKHINYNNESFDMYTRAGTYRADMFSSRDIPTDFCSKII